MSNLGYLQTSLKDQLLSVSLFCRLASIILRAMILSETLALYESFTYLLTNFRQSRLWVPNFFSTLLLNFLKNGGFSEPNFAFLDNFWMT